MSATGYSSRRSPRRTASIEAVEGTDPDQWVLGVQWHPERTWKEDKFSRLLFEEFVRRAHAMARTICGEEKRFRGGALIMSVPMSLEGKVALVTGGSRGIGAAIVRLFVNPALRSFSTISAPQMPRRNWFASAAPRTVTPSKPI